MCQELRVCLSVCQSVLWLFYKQLTSHAYLLTQVAGIARPVQPLATEGTVLGLNPGGGRDFPNPSTPALGPTQPPKKGLFPEGKAAGSWR
jgi:hypothetical protein